MKRTPLARTSSLRFRSKKMAAVYIERRKLVASILDEKPRCAVKGCRRLGTEVHEPLTRARGGSILDPENCKPLCHKCHRLIHDTEPAWAYEQGLLLRSWQRPA